MTPKKKKVNQNPVSGLVPDSDPYPDLDPYLDQDPYPESLEMLDSDPNPDPDSMNPDPQHWQMIP